MLKYIPERPGLALVLQTVLQLTWHGLLFPAPGAVGWALAAVAILPMGAVLLGLRHSVRRGLLLGGVVSLLYFSHGVMVLWSEPTQTLLAALEVVLAVLAVFGLRRPPKRPTDHTATAKSTLE